jgi:hypothetical protein
MQDTGTDGPEEQGDSGKGLDGLVVAAIALALAEMACQEHVSGSCRKAAVLRGT